MQEIDQRRVRLEELLDKHELEHATKPTDVIDMHESVGDEAEAVVEHPEANLQDPPAVASPVLSTSPLLPPEEQPEDLPQVPSSSLSSMADLPIRLTWHRAFCCKNNFSEEGRRSETCTEAERHACR